MREQENSTSTVRTFEVFISTQELYLFKVIDKQLSILSSTFQQFSDAYLQTSQIIFFSFLAFQILTITLLRRKLVTTMREDVMKSRGILNIIPEALFHDH